jgi:hypothetical protein
MLSAWQIVSLDYSEWIDAVAYADLDGSFSEEICFCKFRNI